METTRIAAGIIVYNPNDMDRFEECLRSITTQFEKVYVFNNSTSPVDYHFPESISVLSENKNTGIAHAMNQIFKRAMEDCYEWVVTFDQDSIIPEGILNGYQEIIQTKKKERLGIVCPQALDIRRKYESIKKSPESEYVEKCITSASCTSISAWRNIGGFDEWLFIDLVDNEFCKRLRIADYKILRLNSFVLNQEFGVIKEKPEKIASFWIKISKITGIKNIAKLSYVKVVNPLRVYYTNRNIIYINRKLKKYGRVCYESFYCKNYFGFIFSYIIPSILRSGNKLETTRCTIKGIKEGLSKNVREWQYIQ